MSTYCIEDFCFFTVKDKVKLGSRFLNPDTLYLVSSFKYLSGKDRINKIVEVNSGKKSRAIKIDPSEDLSDMCSNIDRLWKIKTIRGGDYSYDLKLSRNMNLFVRYRDFPWHIYDKQARKFDMEQFSDDFFDRVIKNNPVEGKITLMLLKGDIIKIKGLYGNNFMSIKVAKPKLFKANINDLSLVITSDELLDCIEPTYTSQDTITAN